MNKVKTFKMFSMPYANCHVRVEETNDGFIVRLYSYNTEVLCCFDNYSDEYITLLCSGTYSMTTARHINRFTTEFFGRNLYHECKASLVNDDPEYCTGWHKVCSVPFTKTNFYAMVDNYFEQGKCYY